MSDDFNALAIGNLSLDLLNVVAKHDADVGIKIAALRAAADTLQQAIQVAAIAAVLQNSLGPKRG